MVALLQDTLGEEFFRKHFQEIQEALDRRSAEQATLLAAVQLQEEKYARQEGLLQAIAEQLRSGEPPGLSNYAQGRSCTPREYSDSRLSVTQSECSLASLERPETPPTTKSAVEDVEDVEPMVKEYNDSDANDDEGNTETQTPPQMIGAWVDPDGSFFSGHIIIMCDDLTWRPENPRSPGQQTATYTVEPISEVAAKLVETRLDMSVHIYLAEINKDSGTLDISMSANLSLHWSLVKRTQENSKASLRLAARLQKDASSEVVGGTDSTNMLTPSSPRYYKVLASALIKRKEFDLFIAAVIVINSICIGLQLHYTLGPQGQYGMPTEADGPVVFTILENMFLGIYMFEIMVTLVARGWKQCFADTWFIFDIGLVITGALSAWVIEPILDLNQSSSTSNQNQLDQVLVLRLLRLLRLMRAVRGMRRLQTPWRLVTGLIASTSTMASTLGLLMLILYVFACIGIEIITKDENLWIGERELMEARYSSLSDMLFSLAQFVSLDSLAALYLPLIKLKPGLLMFFVPIFMVVSIVLMNLVTAVIVESALDRASHDKEIARANARQHISKLRPVVTRFFRKVDKHKRGFIRIEDLIDFSLDDLPEEIRPSIKVETMEDLFWILDVSVSGHVSELEFVEGLMNFALDYTSKASVETVLLLKVLRIVKLNARALNTSTPGVSNPSSGLRRKCSVAFTDVGSSYPKLRSMGSARSLACSEATVTV